MSQVHNEARTASQIPISDPYETVQETLDREAEVSAAQKEAEHNEVERERIAAEEAKRLAEQ